jgi:hypothetical protein
MGIPTPDVDVLARGTIDATDERLLRRIGALYDLLDPVPDGLVEKLQFDVTLDALHAEVAQLQRFELEAAGARGDDAGATEVQTVTFTSESLTTMVTITHTGPDRVRIDGWAAPGGGVSIELRIAGSHLQASADADGRFVFEDVPRGLAQFVMRPSSTEAHPPVITPSIDQ